MASSFVKRASYRINSEDDILKLPDVKTAMLLLKSWGLETKGLRTKDQALQRLLDHWKTSSEEQEIKSTEKINSFLHDSSEKLHSNTNKLASKFESMNQFFKQLSVNHQQSISDSYLNIEETTMAKVESLRNRECVLMVAGEIGSGKTSFINLLLNTDILPVDETGCTKTYCQLKTGSKPQATLHMRNQANKESAVRILNLESDVDKYALQKFITSSVSEDGSIIQERVDIEFPFTFLEKGICVLDIPDTIDASVSLEDIISGLPTDVVILYVLDFSNPVNLQAHKVAEFIQRLSNASKDHVKVEDVIVVCNKCDLIPEENLENAMMSTKEQIMESCQELQSEQIAFMSVKEEQRTGSSGIYSEDFQLICKNIHNLFLRKMENHLIEECRWLSQVAKRALYILKVSKLNSNKTLQERREMMAQLELRIGKFEKESKLIIGRLHEEIEMEIDRLFSDIIDHLNSVELKSSMANWSEIQCPKPAKKWKNLKCSAENYIADKLRERITQWEQAKCIKAKIQRQIINKFSQDVELMEDQMKKIGAMLAGGDSSAVVILHKSFKRDSPILLRASPPRSVSSDRKGEYKHRLSDYVCSVGGYSKDVKKAIKPIFKRYKKETCVQLMFKATDIYINCLVNNSQLKEMVAKYVKRFSKDINKIAKMIPELIAMDKRLMSTLEAEVMTTKETMFVIPEHLRRCLILQGEIDLFYVYDMLKLDYQLRDLEWNEKKKLGVGTFAVVHPGILNIGNGLKTEVAIKVFKDPLRTNTVSELLLEDETLRELDHENIIKYYGATLMQKGNIEKKTYWIMIMASCLTNLKDVYLDKTSALKEDNPGKTASGSTAHDDAKDSMMRYSIQICSGLQYLHNQKLVHRDLKLENVLVTKQKEIKLTDVGLTKPEEDISGTFVGSPVYMAPEVHEQKTIYNRKADIYSLSMILWEMWYGIAVNDELDSRIRGRLSVHIRKGTRPLFKAGGFTKPPDTWIDLIQQCWHENPKIRPKALKISDFFTSELSTKNED